MPLESIAYGPCAALILRLLLFGGMFHGTLLRLRTLRFGLVCGAPVWRLARPWRAGGAGAPYRAACTASTVSAATHSTSIHSPPAQLQTQATMAACTCYNVTLRAPISAYPDKQMLLRYNVTFRRWCVRAWRHCRIVTTYRQAAINRPRLLIASDYRLNTLNSFCLWPAAKPITS